MTKSFASPEQKKSMLMPEHLLSTPSFVVFIGGGFAIHAVFAAAAEQAVVAVLVAAVDAVHGLFFVPRHDLLSRVFCKPLTLLALGRRWGRLLKRRPPPPEMKEVSLLLKWKNFSLATIHIFIFLSNLFSFLCCSEIITIITKTLLYPW
ncbi:hypothetical protein C0J52_24952 [Blattella germanica]|nr:hypothetical protein C0J52_24952 [Blattella germanica]